MRIEIDSYGRVKFGYVERAYLNPHTVHSSMAMGLSRAEVEAIGEGSWTTTTSSSLLQCNISRWATGHEYSWREIVKTR